MLTLVLTTLLGVQSADGKAAVLVSAEGKASLSGDTLTVGQRSKAQLLADGLLLGVAGPATVRLDKDVDMVSVVAGQRLRAAGRGTVELSGWRLALSSAVVVVVEHELWVLAGSVTLSRSKTSPASGPTSAPTSAPTSVPTRRFVTAGQKVQLRPRLLVSKEALPEKHRGLGLSYQPPKPWTPPFGKVGIAQAERAVQHVRRSRQATREMAACGCTEGGDSGATGVSDGRTATALEKRNATIRVRVRGVPLRDDK